MYETIIHNLIKIANETGKRLIVFKVADGLYMNFDMFEEEFFWTDGDDDVITTASQQSVVTVLGSQFGQQSSS